MDITDAIRKRFGGIHTTLVTPFDDDLNVDYEALAQIVDFVVDGGVQLIDAPLTTGEVGSLSIEEQKQVIQTIVERVAGRVPVFAGAVRPSTWESILVAKHAEAVGADGVTAHPPYYFRLGDEEIRDHFLRVADATSLPMVMYLSSYGETKVGIALETALELAEHENILAIFPSNSDVAELYAHFSVLKNKLMIFGGREELMLFARPLALDAQSVSTGNFAPELVNEIWEAVQSGDDARAGELYGRLYQWRRLVMRKVQEGQAGAFAVYTKATMGLLGLPGGRTRPPLQQLSSKEMDELRTVVFDVLKLSVYA